MVVYAGFHVHTIRYIIGIIIQRSAALIQYAGGIIVIVLSLSLSLSLSTMMEMMMI